MTEQEAVEIVKEVKWHGDGQFFLDEVNAREMAIKALEKQIPKKIEQKAHPDFPHMGKFWHCTCGVYYLKSGGNYCGNCGQRLEWGKGK